METPKKIQYSDFSSANSGRLLSKGNYYLASPRTNYWGWTWVALVQSAAGHTIFIHVLKPIYLVVGTKSTCQKFFARYEYIRYSHSFCLQIVRCTLSTLGKHPRIIRYVTGYAHFGKTARHTAQKKLATGRISSNGHFAHNHHTLLVNYIWAGFWLFLEKKYQTEQQAILANFIADKENVWGAMGSEVKLWESWKFKLYFHNFFNPILLSDRNNIDSDYTTLDRYKQRAIYFCNYLDCEECTLGWRTSGQASNDILDFFTFGKSSFKMLLTIF